MNDEEPGIMIEFEHSFSFVRILDDMILPTTIKFTAEMYPLNKSVSDDDFEFILMKAKFLLDTIIGRCVALSRDNEIALKILLDENGKNISSNNIMLCPYEPTDETLAILLQSKLKALGNNIIDFGDLKLKSSNYENITFKFIGDSAEILPSIDEWIGERRYFDDPWWDRDDSSLMDVIPPEDTNLDEKPSWAYSLNFLKDVFKPQKDIVIRPDFKLSVIDCDNEE